MHANPSWLLLKCSQLYTEQLKLIHVVKTHIIKVLSRCQECLFWRSWRVTLSADVCLMGIFWHQQHVSHSSDVEDSFVSSKHLMWINTHILREVCLHSLSWVITEDYNRMQFLSWGTQTRISCYACNDWWTRTVLAWKRSLCICKLNQIKQNKKFLGPVSRS